MNRGLLLEVGQIVRVLLELVRVVEIPFPMNRGLLLRGPRCPEAYCLCGRNTFPDE